MVRKKQVGGSKRTQKGADKKRKAMRKKRV